MMFVYLLITVFMAGIFFYLAWKNTEKSKEVKRIDRIWEYIMIGMIVIPMILRIFRIK
ncbi:MAG TPA: hypothetical protein PK466_09210 [Thermotogota bacterium]|nr:hypothetical protein [Thermotogota bacterium]HPJ88464.1 hypothetical protein [Thermotogota bacterium]HPR96497.1 hypothetical protein [Thermotogota bacterium]